MFVLIMQVHSDAFELSTVIFPLRCFFLRFDCVAYCLGLSLVIGITSFAVLIVKV